MKIITRELSEKERDPEDGKSSDRFLFLDIDKENGSTSDVILHEGHAYVIPPRVALGVSVLLDYCNGENESKDNHGTYKYPEIYKEWFDRRILGDCHNFAWILSTASIDIGKKSSFLYKEDMLQAGYHISMHIKNIKYEQQIQGYNIEVVKPENKEEPAILNITDFESKLSIGDIVTLVYYGSSDSCHSFMFIGNSMDGQGMYIQRVGLGGYISIVSFIESCSYYSGFLSGNNHTIHSCVYSSVEK